MVNFSVRAYAAGLAADAIREAIPTREEVQDAGLYSQWAHDQVVHELERLANEMLALSLKLEELS